jgi:ATP-dependent exoDNAse (exonuclease V) beta subunit
VSVREFVEYVDTLRGVGARESEAPTEAGSAVQLMTVHKSKGLEFPVVVIADAAHADHSRAAPVGLDTLLGVTLDLRDDNQCCPAAHQLATLRNGERDEAESRRLLYVAATRAQEKLLISAHTRILKGGALSMSGWLKLLGQAAGLNELAMGGTPIETQPLALSRDVGYRLYPAHEERPPAQRDIPAVMHRAEQVRQDLSAPLALSWTAGADGKLSIREAQPPRRVWRVVSRTARPHAPAWVVGTLVHASLRHWRFTDDGLSVLLRPLALEMGIVDEDLVHASILEAARMLRRFRAHALWMELDTARRWHEVPFSVIEGGRLENGIIDLLYRGDGGWGVAEFKTDRLLAGTDLYAHIRQEGYDDQVRRYVRAVRAQLHIEPKALYCFLNVGNQIAVVSAE